MALDYTQRVMDEFSNPKNMGVLEDANAIGNVGSPECGDMLRMYMKIEDNVIKKCTFQTFGCASAIASSSIATQMIIGKTIDDALKITNKQIIDELGGLPAQKIHCSVLAEEAIKDAIDNYNKNENKKLKQ